MNKKVLIVGAILFAIIIGITVSALSQPKKESASKTVKTDVSATTSKTAKTEADVKTDRDNMFSTSEPTKEQLGTNKLYTAPRAEYLDFTSAEQFKKTAGTRVLFFYSESSEACRTLDKDLIANIAELKFDTKVFKIDFVQFADIAKAYGVVSESTVLKFDEFGKVNGVFSAHDYPTTVALKTNLQI